MKTRILTISAFIVLIGILIVISCSKSADDTSPSSNKLKAAVSCTGIATWSASSIYANAGMQVQYNCNLYKNNWYSQNQNPATNSGAYQVWTLVGTCTGCSSSSSSSSSSSGGCSATAIVPYVQVNGGAWTQTTSASVSVGGSVSLGPQPSSGGSWSWTGPNSYTSTSRQITISNIQTNQGGNYVATYTNTCGAKSTATFAINVSGSSSSSSSSSSGGGTCGTTDFSLGQYYYMMDAWGGGGYCIWYNSMNSWGANAPNVNSTSIVGYPAMVRGCHWSACSTNSGLPKQISALGSLSTNWTQTGTGTAYDAAYDIWFDAASVPGNRAATYELMVWLNWTNTQPIATSYDASGNAIPYASNVSVGGATFNIYHRDNVMSFLLTSKSNSINFSIKPLADYCVARGWISSSAVYLISIEAGWEIIKGGNYTTTAYGITGL